MDSLINDLQLHPMNSVSHILLEYSYLIAIGLYKIQKERSQRTKEIECSQFTQTHDHHKWRQTSVQDNLHSYILQP